MTIQLQGGRTNQKRRTHKAVVDAAVELLAQGRTPTVAEAAEAALVSRTTAYRYFPTQQALLHEAALVAGATPLEHILDQVRSRREVGARVDAVATTFNGEVAEREAQFRMMLRIYLDQWLNEGNMVRPGRRLQWIDVAVAPLRGRIPERQLRRLTTSLAMVMGIEALVVARDVCGLDADEAQNVMRWAAGALVRAAEAQATPNPHLDGSGGA